MSQNSNDIRKDKDDLSGKSDESVSSKQATVTHDSAQNNVRHFFFFALIRSFTIGEFLSNELYGLFALDCLHEL